MKKQVSILASALILTLMSIFSSKATNTYVPNSVTIDKTKAVGEIPIQSGVSSTGAVTYFVPIEIYPGIHGMQPQLAIAYNSMVGNGLLGMGWNISGLSTISRAPKNYYFDGLAENIAMTKDDAFYLDGMRLIKLSETTTQIKYQSEQGNILVTANLSGTVVKYFDVFFPNGTKGTFGYTSNTGTTYFDYPLTSLSNLYGNSITYTYTYADYHYRISKINYANASVEFTYATRPDIIFSYTNSSKVKEDQRLQTITCKYGSATLRTYTMGYTLQKDVSTLTSMSYSGSDGSSFNPLKFYYGEGNTAHTYTQSNLSFLGNCYTFTSPGLIKAVKGRFDILTGDDGLIVAPNLNPYYQSGTKQLTNKYTGTEDIYFYTGINSISTYLPTTIPTGAGFVDIFCANLDGQGYDEIIKVNSTVSGSNEHVAFTVYASSGTFGFVQKYTRTYDLSSMVITDASGNKSVQPMHYYTGDFNGDGKMEVLAVSFNNPFGDTNFPSKCYLFDLESNAILFQGSVFQYNVAFEGTQYNASQALDNSDRLFVGDFDGDEKSEIALVNTNGTQVYKFTVSGSTYNLGALGLYSGLKRGDLLNRTLLLGEFNGDGKPDFFLSPPTTNTSDVNWSIFYSMGNGQFDKTSIIAANNVSGISFFLQDVNGDGRSDLLKVQGNQLLTYISDNNTLTYLSDNVTSMTQNSVIVPFDQNGWNFNNQLIMFKDRNISRYVYNRNDSKEHLLTGMVTSMGVVNKNNYKALYYDGSPFYTNGCCAKYPYDNFQGPLLATESTEQYLNGTLVENPHYQYTNAVVHKQGRGFCGFEKILAQDYIRGNRISVQTYDPYNFSVLKSQDSYLGLDTMSYSISVAANKIAKIQMTNRYSLDKAKNISLNHSYSNFDAYGNPLNETINYGSGITETTVSSFSNNTNESAYLLGFLYDQTKTTNRNGTAWTERFYISANDSKGQPNVIVHYKNGNQVNQKSFSYNSQGLATQKSEFSYFYFNTLKKVSKKVKKEL